MFIFNATLLVMEYLELEDGQVDQERNMRQPDIEHGLDTYRVAYEFHMIMCKSRKIFAVLELPAGMNLKRYEHVFECCRLLVGQETAAREQRSPFYATFSAPIKTQLGLDNKQAHMALLVNGQTVTDWIIE